MNTTSRQDTDFINAVVSSSLLQESIDWIRDNINPDDVYGEKELLEWAQNYDPESVFKESTLALWAESNGYTKE